MNERLKEFDYEKRKREDPHLDFVQTEGQLFLKSVNALITVMKKEEQKQLHKSEKSEDSEQPKEKWIVDKTQSIFKQMSSRKKVSRRDISESSSGTSSSQDAYNTKNQVFSNQQDDYSSNKSFSKLEDCFESLKDGTKCHRGHFHQSRESAKKQARDPEAMLDHFQSVFSCSCDTCDAHSTDSSASMDRDSHSKIIIEENSGSKDQLARSEH